MYTRPFPFLVPSSIASNPPQWLTSEMKYLITLVCSWRIYSKDDQKRSNRHLYSKIMSNIMGKDYKQDVILPLIKAGIIQENSSYSSLYNFSKSYKLTKPYEAEKLIQIPGDILMHSKVVAWQNRQMTSLRVELKAILEGVQNVRIDLEKLREDGIEVPIEQRQLMDELMSGHLFFIEDINDGRIHHSAGNLMREVRPYMYFTIDEIKFPVVGLDCANSQPLLLCLLLNDHYNKCPNDALKKEMDDYREWCEQGLFYEEIIKLFEGPIERSKIKEEIFHLFFTKIKHSKTLKIREVFEKRFPMITAVIDSFKKDNYKDFSLKLREAESKIWINEIAKKFALKNPGVPFFSIHDSIYTTEFFAEELNLIIKDVYSNSGLNVTIHHELKTCIENQAASVDKRKVNWKEFDKTKIAVEMALAQLLSSNSGIAIKQLADVAGLSKSSIEKSLCPSHNLQIKAHNRKCKEPEKVNVSTEFLKKIEAQKKAWRDSQRQLVSL